MSPLDVRAIDSKGLPGSPFPKVRHEFRPGFGGYLFVVHGSLVRPELDEGGAAKIQDEPAIDVEAGSKGAEVLLVETRIA